MPLLPTFFIKQFLMERRTHPTTYFNKLKLKLSMQATFPIFFDFGRVEIIVFVR